MLPTCHDSFHILHLSSWTSKTPESSLTCYLDTPAWLGPEIRLPSRSIDINKLILTRSEYSGFHRWRWPFPSTSELHLHAEIIISIVVDSCFPIKNIRHLQSIAQDSTTYPQKTRLSGQTRSQQVAAWRHPVLVVPVPLAWYPTTAKRILAIGSGAF